jgi:hypothetical protein
LITGVGSQPLSLPLLGAFHHFRQGQTELAADGNKGQEGGIALSALDQSDKVSVQSGQVRQALLAQTLPLSKCPNFGPKRP